MVEISLILESMLESQKDFQYSNTIIYFLVHTLSLLVTRTLSKIEEFSQYNQEFLSHNEDLANAVHKLQVVFKNEAVSLTAKTNSIKVTLMQCPTITKDVFKFPAKPTLRKHLKEFIDKYEAASKGVTMLSPDGNREDTLFLLKVVWGVAQGVAE